MGGGCALARSSSPVLSAQISLPSLHPAPPELHQSSVTAIQYLVFEAGGGNFFVLGFFCF